MGPADETYRRRQPARLRAWIVTGGIQVAVQVVALLVALGTIDVADEGAWIGFVEALGVIVAGLLVGTGESTRRAVYAPATVAALVRGDEPLEAIEVDGPVPSDDLLPGTVVTVSGDDAAAIAQGE